MWQCLACILLPLAQSCASIYLWHTPHGPQFYYYISHCSLSTYSRRGAAHSHYTRIVWSRSVSNIIMDEDLNRVFGSISTKSSDQRKKKHTTENLYAFYFQILSYSSVYEYGYNVTLYAPHLSFRFYLNLVTVVAQTLWTLLMNYTFNWLLWFYLVFGGLWLLFSILVHFGFI